MVFSYMYLFIGAILFLTASFIKGENTSDYNQIVEVLDSVYTIQNLLIAFGVISVCSRLDKLKEKLK